MIRLTKLKEHYNLWTNDRGKTQHLSATEGYGHMGRPYVATIAKVKEGWYKVLPTKFTGHVTSTKVYEPTNKLETLLADVKHLVSTYKYDSEFYHPDLREGYLEEMATHSIFRNLGFKNEYVNHGTCYSLKRENLIGGDAMNVVLQINGLSVNNFLKPEDKRPEKVNISFPVGEWSWTSIKDVANDPGEISKAVQSLMKKVYLVEAAECLSIADKFEDGNVDNLQKEILAGFNIKTEDFRTELINRLEETLKTLKNEKV
ncbi:MAG TPA: hypothetical protein P5509_08525 [Bacteroidales bacterium]|nr:hypothetical protein [Bacteroidales bacterium]